MAYSKEEAREKVKVLVDHFKKDLETGKANKYSEEETKTRYIQPLFEALGWDFSAASEDISMEEAISKKRVDYGFRMNGVPRFFVEAKRVKADLNDPKFAEQAIDYSWHKDCAWAVLTDFEGLKIFNAEWKYSGDPSINKFKEFFYYEYFSRFDELWMLSRKSMELGELDKEALKVGKKIKKTPVGKQIFEDMIRWRNLLNKNIVKNNPKYDITSDELDEAVQRILDRLMFIRTAEDRNISVGDKLIELVRDFESRKRGKMIEKLNELFNKYDKSFNSKLFSSGHFSEQLNIDNEVLIEVLRGMYKTADGSIHYDFSAINADVLGNMYEQYLGHLLKKTAKRAKVEKSHKKRKEQGIYYTPTYIVDYIVRNTVGEYIKGKREESIKNIKILDPACGSGSFLLRVFDELDMYWARKLKKDYKQTKLGVDEVPITKKIEILKDNIYGVDLDEKAVEISRLNLLLKAAEQRHLLPALDKNIKVGNSLIDDPEIAGTKAFNWEEEFGDIMKAGGFDVIVGNPPYIRIQNLDKKEVSYYNKIYISPTKNYDIYILFIEKAFKLLKEGGILGLILPHKFFQGEMGTNIRKFIYQNKALYKIVDFGTNQVFDEASTYTCLLFLSKKQNNHFSYKKFKLGEDFKNLHDISFEKMELIDMDKWNFASGLTKNVISKILNQQNRFSEITKRIFKGSSTGNDEIFLLKPIKENKDAYLVFSKKLNQNIELEKSILHPFLYGEDIKRYSPPQSKRLLLFPYVQNEDKVQLLSIDVLKKDYPLTYKYLEKVKSDLLKRKIELDDDNFYKYSAARSLSYYQQPKIMIPDMLVSIRISYDEHGNFYHGPAIHSVVFNEKVGEHNPYFYLAILNSKLFWFFITNTSTALRGDAYRLTPEFLNSFCFPAINLKDSREKQFYDKVILFAEKILSLNRSLLKIGDKQTDERKRIEEEIEKIDKEIDNLVYNIYGITDQEKKIIEESLK